MAAEVGNELPFGNSPPAGPTLRPRKCYCPVPGAIYLNVMEKNRVHWKRKATGKEFQL